MTKVRFTKIIPVALILIIIAIAIAALVTLARVIFFPSQSDINSQIDSSKEALLSVDAEHTILFKERGPIIADESARSYQIRITPNTRELVTYKGYSGKIIDKISLNNNANSYEQFVFALYKANFIKGNELTGDSDDTRGICATGSVYEFSVISNDNKIEKHLWTSTCSGSKGSLSANANQLIDLFINQIPDAKTVISKSL
jgi:hypothetical protein